MLCDGGPAPLIEKSGFYTDYCKGAKLLNMRDASESEFKAVHSESYLCSSPY